MEITTRNLFAAFAMHAELNTAGAHTAPAKALRDAARESGRTVEQQIAFNAYSVADAMLDESASTNLVEQRDRLLAAVKEFQKYFSADDSEDVILTIAEDPSTLEAVQTLMKDAVELKR